MAIDLKVTTLYLKSPSMDLSRLQKLSEKLGEHGFELVPADDPYWVKFWGYNGNSVMYVIESTSFPRVRSIEKSGKIEVIGCDYEASIRPNMNEGMPPELRRIARDHLNTVLSELELEVIQEETK